MANEYTVNAADLTAVADAIRAKAGTSDGLSFPDGFAAAIAAIPAGAQVASGSFTVSKSSEVTIHPGFVVKSLCVGTGGGTNTQHTGGGLYVDGTVVGGDIKSVYSVSNATKITFMDGKNSTFYWLATS